MTMLPRSGRAGAASTVGDSVLRATLTLRGRVRGPRLNPVVPESLLRPRPNPIAPAPLLRTRANRGVTAMLLASLASLACRTESQRPGPTAPTAARASAAPSAADATTGDPSAPGAADDWFTDVTAESGVTFIHDAGRSPQRWLPETMGAGVAVLDADGDGRMDLYFVDSGAVPEDGAGPAPGRNRLYRNLGGWRFEDVTAAAGVAGRGLGMGAAAGDVDADGDADLVVTGYGGATALYLNDGAGAFRDATSGSGVADGAWTTGAAFLHADGDGRLDLLVQRYVRWSRALHRPCFQRGVEVYCTPDVLEPLPSRLLLGRGDGTFADASEAWGVSKHPGKGLALGTADLDGDGDADGYFANDTYQNLVFRNDGGRFEEIGLVSGAAYGADGREEAGMGVAISDLDADGLLDVVVANFEHEPASFYRNEGGLSFTEVSALTGVAAASSPLMKWGTIAADLDLDGDDDLVIAAGHVYDNAREAGGALPHAQPALLLRNGGDGRFTAAPAGALGRPRVGRGLASADLDDDGDVDLVLTSNGGPPALLRNDAGGASISVHCVGSGRDAGAYGTRVRVSAGGREQVREVSGGGSYLSQSDLRLVFGLGSAARADRIVVTWPGGRVQELAGVPAGSRLRLVEDTR